MGKKRTIDTDFFLDERTIECCLETRLLFFALLANADDEGYGKANTKLLKSQLFPYDTIKLELLDKWLMELYIADLISLYEYDGQNYYYIKDFSKSQHKYMRRIKKSVFPKAQDGQLVNKKSNVGQCPANAGQCPTMSDNVRQIIAS